MGYGGMLCMPSRQSKESMAFWMLCGQGGQSMSPWLLCGESTQSKKDFLVYRWSASPSRTAFVFNSKFYLSNK